MDIPNSLKSALENQAEGIKQTQLLDAAKAISERYRTQSGQGKRLLTSDIEALAYAYTRMPATFGAVFSALEYTLAHCDHPIESLIDVGAGTGAAAWAADELIDLKSITCIEREASMRQLGKKLAESGSHKLRNSKWIPQDLNTNALFEKADLVISSYVLSEMNHSERIKAIQKLWDAANTILLIVEPGTPVCYSQLKEIRELMLAKGAHVIAPCPHEDVCKINGDDWCHFTCRIARSKIHRQLKGGDAPFEDEKYTYLALSKHPAEYSGSRILRHPKIESGYVKLTVCNGEGIREITVTKKSGELYKKARKAKCGDEL